MKIIKALTLVTILGSFLISPSSSAQAAAPTGSHDEANCFRISGWAADQDSPNQSLTVRMYKDPGSGNNGTLIYSETTLFNDPGLNSTLSGWWGVPVSGNHRFGTNPSGPPNGFSPISELLIDDSPHVIRVTAVDPTDGQELPLSFTDKPIQCFLPTQPTISNLPSCSSGPYTATVSWTGGSPTTVFYYGVFDQGFIVDIDDDPNFGSFYNKLVPTTSAGPYSTDTTNFLGIYPNNAQALSLQPNVTYYARVFNGNWSPISQSFRVPTCSGVTPTPIPTNVPTITPTPTGLPGPQAVSLNWAIFNPLYGGSLNDNIFTVIFLVSNWVFNIAGSLIVILIIYAGVMFMLSRGIPAKYQQARNILYWAIIGFAVVLIGKGFIYLVDTFLRGGNPPFF